MSLVLAFLILKLFWLVGGQEAAVYIGPEVNGSINNGNNDVVVLGGLFPAHDAEENQCGKVLDTDIQSRLITLHSQVT